jgi:hypothetical protein
MAEAGRSEKRSFTSLGHGVLMMDCRLGKGGRKKMTWDPHVSEWRGER